MKFLRAVFKLPPLVKILIILLILASIWLTVKRVKTSTSRTSQYQTAEAEIGNLTVVVTASGQVSSQNSATVETQASGVVKKVYVENGQKVKSGDKIAELDLDIVGKQRSNQALASYQNAKNSVKNAEISYYSLHSDLLTNWKEFMDIAQSSLYENSNKTPNIANRQLPEYMTVNDDWLGAEAKYKQQENVVKQAQTALNSAWLLFQQTSSIIYAPIAGTVTGLSLQEGLVITSQSNTSGTATSQKIASIQTDASPVIQVNLTQIDTPKVKVGNKATLNFDAFPNKSFTGKVISIDTIGSVSSGVTTYPSTIMLDTQVPDILSNMTANANIITQVKDNVLLVPVSSIQTQDGESFVRVIKNGQPQQIAVETGLSSSSQFEIVSGLNEGDTVVTGSKSTSSTRSNGQTQSPFSGFGGGMFRR